MRTHLLVGLVVVLGPPAAGRAEEKSVAEWVGLLKHQDPAARAQAARALGEKGAEARAAVGALREALADADRAVRGRAAVALWRIERPLPTVLPALVA